MNYADIMKGLDKTDITEVVAKWRYLLDNNKDLISAKIENFRAVSIAGSNTVEGIQINYHDTRSVLEDNESMWSLLPAIKYMTIINSTKAFNVILDLAYNTPISPKLIKSIHKIQMARLYSTKLFDKGERPGEYKVHDYCVGINSVGSIPHLVSPDIEDLCNEINEIVSTDIDTCIKTVAYFHCRFENIHPFADGNGRTGRVLLNYLLHRYKLPMIVIDDTNKEAYYSALECYDAFEQIEPMAEFIRIAIKSTWKNILTE